METFNRSDQLVLAATAGIVGLMMLVSLRITRLGAAARMGTIVAGIMLLLTVIVGLRAREVTSPRSAWTPGASEVHHTADRPG